MATLNFPVQTLLPEPLCSGFAESSIAMGSVSRILGQAWFGAAQGSNVSGYLALHFTGWLTENHGST